MAIDLDHIIVPVTNIESSARFYYRVLRAPYEPVALVRISPHLVLQLIERPIETSLHLAFSMTKQEFDGAIERLKAADVPYGDNFDTVGNMKEGRASGSQKNGASIYFRDPDAHMLEIMHYENA